MKIKRALLDVVNKYRESEVFKYLSKSVNAHTL